MSISIQLYQIYNFSVQSRKRSRHAESHKKYLQKQLVERGKEHITKTGNSIPEKIFNAQIKCKCSRECAKRINIIRQRNIFDTYFNRLNTWSAKTQFIRANVRQFMQTEKMTATSPIVTSTKRTLQYYLMDESLKSHNFCKRFF